MTDSSYRKSQGSEQQSAETKAKVDRIQRKFTTLQGEAQFSNAYNAIGRIETDLNKLPLDLDALRTRGYLHSGQLEERLTALQDQWQGTRPRVESAVRDQVKQLRSDLARTGRLVSKAKSGQAATISAAEGAVEGLESKVSSQRAGFI